MQGPELREREGVQQVRRTGEHNDFNLNSSGVKISLSTCGVAVARESSLAMSFALESQAALGRITTHDVQSVWEEQYIHIRHPNFIPIKSRRLDAVISKSGRRWQVSTILRAREKKRDRK